MTKTRCLALAVCLLAVLPTAVQARAHRRAVRIGPWVGQYEVTLKKTTQDTTYTYHHAARNPCDASADGSGGSHALLAGGSGTVSATGVSPPGEFNTPAPSIQVQLGSLPSLLSHGTETRSTNVTYGQSSGCGSGGGGGSAPPAPDCGTKPVSETYSLIGTTAFQLEWQREQASSPPDAFSFCAQYAPWQFPSVLPVANIAPGLIVWMMPLAPNTTSSVCAPSSTRLMTTSLCAATSEDDLQPVAPASRKSMTGSLRTS